MDTTLVVAVANNDLSLSAKTIAHVAANQPAEVPSYAHRELLAGVIATLCAAHNRLKSTANPGEAMQAMLNLPKFVGRTREGQLKAFAEALTSVFSSINNSNSTIDFDSVKRQMCQDLAIRAHRTWKRGRSSSSFNHVQPLGCFVDDDLVINEQTGLLMGPAGGFQCERSARCSAAQYLYENKDDVEKIISILHPDNLNAIAGSKQENATRRKALKALLKEGPANFDKRHCRGLGDAYFAIMCPIGSHVATTNLIDHDLLCKAIGKVAISP